MAGLRFVILTHDWPELHWDFMLESGNALLTWRLDSEPVLEKEIEATPLADHRLEYLSYEGPVSGGRGTVVQWDAGTYEFLRREESGWLVRLKGQKIDGTAQLETKRDRVFVFFRK